MKMKKWYPGHDRVSDQKAPTGTARAPIEEDEERLAMRQGDMPPPVPERVANPRRPISAGISKQFGKDAPCHSRRHLLKSMV